METLAFENYEEISVAEIRAEVARIRDKVSEGDHKNDSSGKKVGWYKETLVQRSKDTLSHETIDRLLQIVKHVPSPRKEMAFVQLCLTDRMLLDGLY